MTTTWRATLLVIALALPLVATAAPLRYLGEWYNGRGETLAITKKTLRYADNKPVPYRDVTRAADAKAAELLITAAADVNAFPGKTLRVLCEKDAMTMTTYASHADCIAGANALSTATWFKEQPVAEGPSKQPGAGGRTPSAGSAERKAIALAIHPHCERELKQDVVLKFDRLVVSGDWAMAYVRPLQPNGEAINFAETKFKERVAAGAFDPAGEALLQKKNGQGTVVEWRFGNTDTEMAEWITKHHAPPALLK